MTEPTRILIIDDNEDDRMLYRRVLQKSTDMQYSFMEAEDGDSGLDMANQVAPSCILLDYSLPGRNGIEVLKRIRSQFPFVPVVMMTGQGNEKVAVTAIQEGAQNYISKSTITLETLEHVVRMAIEHCMMQKRIHEQRTSLEVFTRALAHDMKEPVRTIRSFVELLAQYEKLSEKGQNYFKHIQNASDRMLMLIDTVFMYTRLDDPGQMPRELCPMQNVLEEVQENVMQLINEQKARITSSGLPEVTANRMQMIQVLQNLICNAINHSDNPVSISIVARREGEQWQFCVQDDGPGIDKAYLQKIFDPFKRFMRHEIQGAGLGLAICKKIIESHGGKIWCESEPGKGAKFMFTLGVARDDEASPVASLATNAAARTTNGHALANVLVVDDSRADAEMTRFRLIERGHLQCNLMMAKDGEEALTVLRNTHERTPIDLMLLDINMPEMDGFELLEKVRADDALKNLVVVMCTGSIYDKDMARAKSLGAAGYLTKPLEFDKLREVIQNIQNFRLSEIVGGYALKRSA